MSTTALSFWTHCLGLHIGLSVLSFRRWPKENIERLLATAQKPTAMGNQCFKDANAASKVEQLKKPALLTKEVPPSQQMRMEEGLDLCHYVSGHWAIQCKTEGCEPWIYLRRSQWLKRCHLCGEEWANSIQEPNHLFKKED